jgi:integrase
MATTKIILKKDKIKADGSIPLYLRIIKDRKAKFISLGYSVLPQHWNDKDGTVRKSHPNAKWLNNYLAKKISDAQRVSLELEATSEYTNPKRLKQSILGRSSEKFIPYAEKYVTTLEKKGKIGSYDKANAAVSKLKKYIGNKNFTFDDLTVYFLKNYEEYLQVKLSNSVNTIHSNMKIIRRIVKEAINDDLFTSSKNPFLKYKLKWEKTEIMFLTEEELTSLENLELAEGSMKYHHRNIYVFACYAGGLRISDICQLKWGDFDGERIIVNTMKSDSVVSIKLPQKAIEILNLYMPEKQNPHFYIFPLLKDDVEYNPKQLFTAISSVTAYTNTDLKDLAKAAKINKRIHFHTSRHTWATRALRKGMRIEYVSKLMGHSSIKTTQIYAKIVNEDLDKAMDVFND